MGEPTSLRMRRPSWHLSDPHEPVPLFLSDYDDDRYQEGREYTFGNGKAAAHVPHVADSGRRTCCCDGGRRFRAVFAMDSTRNVVANTKASLAGVAPVSLSAAPPESAPQQPRVAAVSPVTPEPAGGSAELCTGLQAARRSQPDAAASASPSREEIAAAYQTALKSRVVALEPAVRDAAAPPPPRRGPAHRSG